ncbi:MAG: hypothetical protein DRI57_19915 [Deltaproteobacteria bacterium]|nr:MAG: hypothetical protein DRI57_19915 [Deltaproteobacteria bacterium]
MILHPWILGLIIGHSALLAVFSLGVINAWQIFRGWDYNSTEEKQFLLEKKTYLVSTVMNFALFIQILMLFLFEMAADELANVLPGAMCAVGTLSSGSYGFPLLNLKIVSFFAYFIWLMINYLDNLMETYPLVRRKYLGLMLIYPLAVVETALLFMFASDLDPSVITSCCGSVYNEGTEGLGGSLAGASASFILPLFFSIVILLLINRFVLNRRDTGRKRLGNLLEFPLWIAFFITAIAVIISFISIYVYEMLSHKCPFCFMGAEYCYYGVPLYFFLFIATAAGMTGGLLEMIEQPQALKEKAGFLQKRMNAVSLWSMSAFIVTGFLPFVIYYIKTGRLI